MAYTIRALGKRFNLHHAYVTMTKDMKLGVRLPSIPEDISENIVKFYLIHQKGHSVTWECQGDLLSKNEGKIECKCFTSEGPISFTPSSDWDVIYFLDARQWLDRRFTIYRLGMSMKSEKWQDIVINKNKEPRTFGGQADVGRRPRITWGSLYPQIFNDCEKVFEGYFEDIYRPRGQQLVPLSHSPPVYIDDSLRE